MANFVRNTITYDAGTDEYRVEGEIDISGGGGAWVTFATMTVEGLVEAVASVSIDTLGSLLGPVRLPPGVAADCVCDDRSLDSVAIELQADLGAGAKRAVGQILDFVANALNKKKAGRQGYVPDLNDWITNALTDLASNFVMPGLPTTFGALSRGIWCDEKCDSQTKEIRHRRKIKVSVIVSGVTVLSTNLAIRFIIQITFNFYRFRAVLRSVAAYNPLRSYSPPGGPGGPGGPDLEHERPGRPVSLALSEPGRDREAAGMDADTEIAAAISRLQETV